MTTADDSRRTRMLCAWSNPKDATGKLPYLSVSREMQHVIDANILPSRLAMITECTPERLFSMIRTHKPRVLIMSGHTAPKGAIPLAHTNFERGANWQSVAPPIIGPPLREVAGQHPFARRLSSQAMTLDRDYTCERVEGCNMRATSADPSRYIDTTVRIGNDHFKATAHPVNYDAGPCMENGWGRLRCIPRRTFTRQLVEAYGESPPDLVVYNMCDSNQLARSTMRAFGSDVSVIFWGTIAEDLSAMQFFKQLFSALLPYMQNADEQVALHPEQIQAAFDSARTSFLAHNRLGNPRRDPTTHGMPHLSLGRANTRVVTSRTVDSPARVARVTAVSDELLQFVTPKRRRRFANPSFTA